MDSGEPVDSLPSGKSPLDGELNSPPGSDDSDSEGSISDVNHRSPASSGPDNPSTPNSPLASAQDSAPDSPASPHDSGPSSPQGSRPSSPGVPQDLGAAAGKSDNEGELSDSSSESGSSSSGSSARSRSPARKIHTGEAVKSEITGHGQDLSDVSDLDSNDGSLDLLEEDIPAKPATMKVSDKKETVGMSVDDSEQLDFEAEELLPEKEEGECEGRDERSEGEAEGGEGELKGEDLEEGEVTDDDDNRPEETEPRPICRFYNRGQCTWGASCRFLHPGVTDKGNYTMFDMVRPLVPNNAMYPAIDYRPGYDRPPGLIPMGGGGRKEEQPVVESAWERGLRQAKEMMRKSTKRKETDMDFEEKKMNLSIGQEELDKENDYYTRPASPVLKEDPDAVWGLKSVEAVEGGKYHHRRSPPLSVPRYEDFPEPPYYPSAPRPTREQPPPWSGADYSRRVHYESRAGPGVGARGGKYRGGQQHRQIPDYYDQFDEPPPPKKVKRHPTREVIVQRVVEKTWREDSRHKEDVPPPHRGRGDEWADPWMRSKSPTGRKAGGTRTARRQSYSSGSSYSSSSRSGSSASSYSSSYSHNSRSRSGGSKSRSPSRSRSPPLPRSKAAAAAGATRKPPAAYARKAPHGEHARLAAKGKPGSSERKAASDRLLCMNPPAPSPRKQRDVRPPSPGMMRKSAQNPPPPLAAVRPSPLASGLLRSAAGSQDRSKVVLASAAMAAKAAKLSRQRSSHSTSNSDSSGSSSDSSESSYSSSSSSREPTPKAVRPAKRMPIDERERLALVQKVKAIDALKLSGQKPQIKLTLKTPGANPPAPVKRSATTGLPDLPELNLVRRDRAVAASAVTAVGGKKRAAEAALDLEADLVSKVAALSNKPASKKATSRREELLKQLKAVEDAIARKRSKN